MTACHPSVVIYCEAIWVAGDLNHFIYVTPLALPLPNLISTLNESSSTRLENKNI